MRNATPSVGFKCEPPPMNRPFYIHEPCATCRHEIGPDGVWVTEEQKWCRRCAALLRGLLNSVLGGQN